MTNDRCAAYQADPAANPAHALECAECARLALALERVDRQFAAVAVDPAPSLAIPPASLPLAPWEGAAYRSWSVAIACGAAILLLASSLFVVLGVSPIGGIIEAISSQADTAFRLLQLAEGMGGLIHRAPLGVHLLVASAFIAVNLLFVFLLRRAPKGIDVDV
ncbi:MAG TPA: hypothetical protein VMT00_08815 [Thermoanaerobaculia bacterium]|nr:hypothetical protein [Thermoanaerobaculia bacterium]